MLKVAIVALLISAPASAEWAPPTSTEWGVVGATAGLTVLDALQTSDCQFHKRPGRMYCYENNPLMRGSPGRARLWGTAAAELAVMTAAFYALPPKWRTILPAGVCVMEVVIIARGASAGLTFRF